MSLPDDPAELAAHYARLGYRIVAHVPSDPALLTAEHVALIFGGDVDGGLRAIYGLEPRRIDAPDDHLRSA